MPFAIRILLCCCFITCGLAEEPYWQSRPGGCAGMAFEFPKTTNKTGYASMDFTWAFPMDPGRDIREYPISKPIQGEDDYLGYYWATQFGFSKKGSGYFGLQTIGINSDANPNPDRRQNPRWNIRKGKDRIAIFSIWNALDGRKSDAPGATAAPFGHEGSGWSCKVPYPWVAGRHYRLRLERLEEYETRKGVKAGWWRVSVMDLQTRKNTIVGDILAPQAWGGIGHKPGMFAEYYAQTVSDKVGAEDAGKKFPRVCETMPRAAIQIGVPSATTDAKKVVDCTHISANPYGKCAHKAGFFRLDKTPIKKGTRMKAESVICVTGTLEKNP